MSRPGKRDGPLTGIGARCQGSVADLSGPPQRRRWRTRQRPPQRGMANHDGVSSPRPAQRACRPTPSSRSWFRNTLNSATSHPSPPSPVRWRRGRSRKRAGVRCSRGEHRRRRSTTTAQTTLRKPRLNRGRCPGKPASLGEKRQTRPPHGGRAFYGSGPSPETGHTAEAATVAPFRAWRDSQPAVARPPVTTPKARSAEDGGEGGIRTHDTVSRIHAFQACSFNRSDTSPQSDLNCRPAARSSRVFHLAEREGFEPPIPFPVYLISNQAPSASSAISPRTCVVLRQVASRTTLPGPRRSRKNRFSRSPHSTDRTPATTCG